MSCGWSHSLDDSQKGWKEQTWSWRGKGPTTMRSRQRHWKVGPTKQWSLLALPLTCPCLTAPQQLPVYDGQPQPLVLTRAVSSTPKLLQRFHVQRASQWFVFWSKGKLNDMNLLQCNLNQSLLFILFYFFWQHLFVLFSLHVLYFLEEFTCIVSLNILRKY